MTSVLVVGSDPANQYAHDNKFNADELQAGYLNQFSGDGFDASSLPPWM